MPVSSPSLPELEALWEHHHALWRDPLQVISAWEPASERDLQLFHYTVQGEWWDILEQTASTLLVTREYEHLVMAMQVQAGKPHISYMRLPHPSGIAYDAAQGMLYIACTRNPNQILDLKPVIDLLPRADLPLETMLYDRPLLPVRTRFFPGSFYLHDLGMIGGDLHANAVGQNAVLKFDRESGYERVWYPHCIEVNGKPVFEQNHLQLNSIAAGDRLENSYFSASVEKVSARRPGHKNFPVDKRGVIFAGATREVMGRGLTRPHSARLHEGRVWVDNSGYGELGFIENGQFCPVIRLPGWTRGLYFHDQIAFVGTSQVMRRFQQYAPGLQLETSQCGLHAVDTQTGKLLGSLTWLYGNQIFAIQLVPNTFTSGFPFVVHSKRAHGWEKKLFYAFRT